MDEQQEKVILLTALSSMVTELDARLGDDNPWREIDFEAFSVRDLRAIKRTLHELLYAPPSRS